MKKLIKSFYRWLARRLAIRRNVHYHPDLQVGMGTTITAPDHLHIGRKVKIAARATIACNGKIGDGVLISSQVGIVGRYDHDHTTVGRFISESPWLYAADARARDSRDAVIIEDDVWIGFGVIILSGITIGRGAIIAAGAVVIKDVEPYTIIAGNPAVKVGERFPESERAQHEMLLKQQG